MRKLFVAALLALFFPVAGSAADAPATGASVPMKFHKLEERVYFGFDRTDIAPREEPTLRTIVLTLAQRRDGHVRIEGHTDLVGSPAYNEALSQSRTWQAQGRRLSVSINVSANQLSRASFVEYLRHLIAELEVDPTLIELEVTESVIIEGAGDARESLYEVAALGVGIAIDDFGTGYSGLAYLKRLPIDTVKIDQSFVRDLTVDPDDKAIVTAIVAMAKSLGVDVVAEGVETEEQLEELKRLGCTRGQGFLLARPMTAAGVARFLARLTAPSAAD